MRSLRPLLRLDDKVAAEGRRLQYLGGPPMKWVATATLATALFVHAMVLLLPVPHVRTELPAPSLATDFPLVWRLAVAEELPPAPAPAVVSPPKRPAAVPEPVPAPPQPLARTVQPPAAARALVIEPVSEPPPGLSLTMISTEIEAMIPNPDPPPPPIDAGPTPGSERGKGLSLIQSVDPVFPLAARTLRADGRVTLKLFVLPDGRVGRATVEACTRPGVGFERAALDAVKQWRYEPAPLQSGSRTVTVTVHFQRPEKHP